MKFLLVLSVLVACTFAESVNEPKPYYATFAAANERIIGGAAAARNQFPYQVSLQWGFLGIWQHICGGAIISGRTVITAAHCITESPTFGNFRIRAGILLLNEDVASLQTITVQNSILHPDYAGGVNPHDLALLRLPTSVTFTESVQGIALPAAGLVPTGSAILSGWGATTAGLFPNMPNQLQWTPKPIASFEVCRNLLIALLGNAGPLDPTNICTGAQGSGVSACSGDSGGPLTQNNVLIGIVSWGITPCGTNGAPSVYGGVSNYIDWINSNTV